MLIKAVSLWEPWASLMAAGVKTIETRSWYTYHRGPLLICAATRWRRPQKDMLQKPFVQQALSHLSGNGPPIYGYHLPFSHALCVVDLYHVWRTEELRAGQCALIEYELGDFTPCRYAWFTRNARRIDPFPVVGRRGLFDVEMPE